MTALYKQIIGQGPDLILLHGWGLNHAVWQNILPLQNHFRLHLYDLPGHGKSKAQDFVLAEVYEQLLNDFPAQSFILGWSMGGLLAQQLSILAPKRITGLILLNTSPQFVQDAEWSSAISEQDLHTFADGLIKDYSNTLRRFLIIQALGEQKQKYQVKELQKAIIEGGTPNISALRASLNILRSLNLRPHLSNIKCPCLIIHGANDRLCPKAAAEYLHQHIAQSQLHLLDNCAHAPFLSQPDQAMHLIKDFIYTELS